MTLRHLKIFSAVCRLESITLAAEEMNMAQPAVSYAIRELEGYYETKLFERMNRRLYITEAGEQLLIYADSILAQFDEARDVLRDIQTVTKVRVGTNASYGISYLPQLIAGFKEEYGQIPIYTLVDNSRQIEEKLIRNDLDFGITDYRCVLSLRDPENKTKYHDDDEMWNKAENALRDVMNSLGIEYTEEIGEAAFYGPKLDVNVKPAVGNEITLSTCQLDFCLPAKFNLSYVDKDGEKKTPVVLHRAILGSLDRFMAYILEETKGNLPTWLAPVQVRVMPVKTDNDEIMNYAHEIVDALEAKNVRVELDDRAEKLGYRMREGQIQKVPYLLVIGFNEQENKTVSYRLHGQQDTTTLGLDEFVEKIDTEIKNKAR